MDSIMAEINGNYFYSLHLFSYFLHQFIFSIRKVQNERQKCSPEVKLTTAIKIPTN